MINAVVDTVHGEPVELVWKAADEARTTITRQSLAQSCVPELITNGMVNTVRVCVCVGVSAGCCNTTRFSSELRRGLAVV